MEDSAKASTTIEMDKHLFLKFKSLCVLKETTMSEQIEAMIREWVAHNEDAEPSVSQGPDGISQKASPGAETKKKGKQDIVDDLEGQTEQED